jgi:hypothetical protein
LAKNEKIHNIDPPTHSTQSKALTALAEKTKKTQSFRLSQRRFCIFSEVTKVNYTQRKAEP